METTLEQEINIWLLFWGFTALIFVTAWWISNINRK